MPRKPVASHRRRDKLANKIDTQTRAQAQLAEFLSAKAAEENPPISRGALIEKVLISWARRAGFTEKG